LGLWFFLRGHTICLLRYESRSLAAGRSGLVCVDDGLDSLRQGISPFYGGPAGGIELGGLFRLRTIYFEQLGALTSRGTTICAAHLHTADSIVILSPRLARSSLGFENTAKTLLFLSYLCVQTSGHTLIHSLRRVHGPQITTMLCVRDEDRPAIRPFHLPSGISLPAVSDFFFPPSLETDGRPSHTLSRLALFSASFRM